MSTPSGPHTSHQPRLVGLMRSKHLESKATARELSFMTKDCHRVRQNCVANRRPCGQHCFPSSFTHPLTNPSRLASVRLQPRSSSRARLIVLQPVGHLRKVKLSVLRPLLDVLVRAWLGQNILICPSTQHNNYAIWTSKSMLFRPLRTCAHFTHPSDRRSSIFRNANSKIWIAKEVRVKKLSWLESRLGRMKP